ncbi:MAG TPA: carbamoyltransferase C-terminal domain-containing protein [Pseudonocardiaceae bacterium]
MRVPRRGGRLRRRAVACPAVDRGRPEIRTRARHPDGARVGHDLCCRVGPAGNAGRGVVLRRAVRPGRQRAERRDEARPASVDPGRDAGGAAPAHRARRRSDTGLSRRQWWRPVAPIVQEDHMADWFECPRPSPYMLEIFRIRADRLAEVPAIAHLDGTARVQTLTEPDDPVLYAMISAFASRPRLRPGDWTP